MTVTGWQCDYFDQAPEECVKSEGCCDVLCNEDTGCAGRAPNPNNCDIVDGRKGRCLEDCTCDWDPCTYDYECDVGKCCEKEVGIISISPPYGCVDEGTIKNGKYLCDPPKWKDESKSSNIIILLEQIWEFLIH